MFGNVIAAVKNATVGWARTAVKAVGRLARPARAVAAATAGVARDATRSRRELLAENALLRQQLIVLRRSVKRPAVGRAHRLFSVVRARCTRGWRDALHLVQPDTLLRWHRDLFKVVCKWTDQTQGSPRRRSPRQSARRSALRASDAPL